MMRKECEIVGEVANSSLGGHENNVFIDLRHIKSQANYGFTAPENGTYLFSKMLAGNSYVYVQVLHIRASMLPTSHRFSDKVQRNLIKSYTQCDHK